MASQIRYFKTRYQQLRHVVERLKRDIAEHKKYNHVDPVALPSFMSDCPILASEPMAFFKAKLINFECEWTKDMVIKFLPTLSTRMESVECRLTSNLSHSHSPVPH